MSIELTKEALREALRAIIVDETWESGGAGIEALERELRRRGVTWFLYADLYARFNNTPPERGRAPWIGGGTFQNAGQRLRNGNTLICDYAADVIYEVTEDWQIVWSFGEFGVAGSDSTHLDNPTFVYLDEDVGKILIADTNNHRVLEIGYPSGGVLNSLSATSSGVLNYPQSAVYTEDGELLITNWGGHFVVKTDWNGVESWSFGTYGTSGQTDALLYNPTTAFRFPTGRPRYVLIGDYHNDRILAVNEDGTVSWKIVAPLPRCGLGLDERIGIGNNDVCFSVERTGMLHTYVPFSGGYFDPTIDGTYLNSQPTMILEFDPHFHRPYALPISKTILRGYPLPAAESVGPIYSGADNIENNQVLVTFPYEHVTFYVRSTQTATFEVLVARTGIGGTVQTLSSLRFIDWIPISSTALVADTWSTVTVTDHAPMMGARITMGVADGAVDVFVSRLPKGIG